jgi:fibronectin type 3 domain-containing protein
MRSKQIRALVVLVVIACMLSVAAKSKHSVTLTWAAPKLEKGASVASYNVYRRTPKDHVYKKIANHVLGPPYEDTQVKGGQTYIYAVAAVDPGGHESRLSEVSKVTIPSD